VREVGNARNVEHIEPGVAKRLAEQQACIRPDRRAPCIEIATIDERRVDAEARQRIIEKIVRASVKRARRDNVRPRREEGYDRKMHRCLSAGGRDRADTVFERRDPFLQHGAGRIRDARIDVPRTLHVEQRRGMIAVRENERSRLVDRRRACTGRRIRRGAGVQRQRVEMRGPGLGHRGPQRVEREEAGYVSAMDRASPRHSGDCARGLDLRLCRWHDAAAINRRHS
jgi:hypothetical protein